MTTVAFRKYKNHIEFAADTGVSNGFHSSWQKIYKFKDGIGGGSGDLASVLAIRNLIIEKGFSPELKLRFKGLDYLFWSFKLKRFYVYARADPFVELSHTEYHTTGSGCEFATGALAAGATPKQAVLIACKYDQHTRGPVTTLSAKF